VPSEAAFELCGGRDIRDIPLTQNPGESLTARGVHHDARPVGVRDGHRVLPPSVTARSSARLLAKLAAIRLPDVRFWSADVGAGCTIERSEGSTKTNAPLFIAALDLILIIKI
jgi:hypothetical protein